MVYLVPKSAGDDCVIQRDRCRELLVFWCFDVYKITAMIAKISCIWLSLCAGYSTSYLSSGSLGFSWIQLSLDVNIFSCIWLSFGQRATSTASFSVSLPYYIVRWFSLLYHLLDTSFYKHLQRQGNKFYTFWCHQVVSRLIVDLVVDNPFNGYPATHACYRWIMSATNKKQQ
ncbi:hypothetical protein O0I10_002300 [Lichtheimia ornata]|uniref:Uncharacterized protein n=1 Tax=Lichtheimia ornata TaxID=688661 RepID=A0AAD7XYL4_9FUNG|nr:uncharacterized protein O0I10_002300 [Lichtheimia ornata]KAJ8661969.1 hypothetical protein O0I10_002300 [Lichtheimia ornata]